MSFQIGDRIAHPLHGAGVIDRIESRRIGGESREYFVLKLQGSGMVVMVPKNACDEVGVRPIVDADTAYDLLRRIPDMDVSMADNWNKRYRENMQRIKSGNLTELAAVIKALTQRDETPSIHRRAPDAQSGAADPALGDIPLRELSV